MSFVIGILMLLLIVTCVVLILLVLVQLPKKDAGAGIAFGGGTADALFGAGSGNVLTKITKYAIGVLLVLSLGLGYLQDKAYYSTSGATFEKMVQEQQMQQPIAPATAPAAQTPPAASVPMAVPTTSNGAPAK